MTYTVFCNGLQLTALNLGDAICYAETKLKSLPALQCATLTLHDEEGCFVTSRSNRRIQGVFYKQSWGGRKNDLAITIEEVPFDATDAILKLSYEDLQALSDHDESSDAIGRAHVDWDGPCEVELEEALCEYFGVGIDQVSREAFEDIKAFACPVDVRRETLTLTLEVDIDRAPGADLHDFLRNMDLQMRSRTPGVVVSKVSVVEMRQAGEIDQDDKAAAPARGMKP